MDTFTDRNHMMNTDTELRAAIDRTFVWTVTNSYGVTVASFETAADARQYLKDNDANTDKLGRGYLYSNATPSPLTGKTYHPVTGEVVA